jgi:hypothetical protein
MNHNSQEDLDVVANQVHREIDTGHVQIYNAQA